MPYNLGQFERRRKFDEPCRDIARRRCRPIRARKMPAGGNGPDSTPSTIKALAKDIEKDIETMGKGIGRGDPAWADIVRVSCDIEAGNMLKDQAATGKQTKSGRPLAAVA